MSHCLPAYELLSRPTLGVLGGVGARRRRAGLVSDAVPGCATGASRIVDIEEAVRFCVEGAKAFGAGACRFYHPVESVIMQRYGPLDRLQKL